jgi:primosomal protein N' (replication factor Y)
MRCERPYTFYNEPQQLCCHYCGSIQSIIIHCEDCQSENISPIGVGTEQMEEFLNHYFNNKKTLRIDRGSITTERSLKVALESIYNNEADIIVGTQMIAKGHHFPNVTMVGIINIDGSLYSGDYRATERAAQLIVQVSGRAGRCEKQGEVYLQTYQPDNYFLKQLFISDYLLVCDSLLEERKLGKLPPYQHSIILRTESPILKDSIGSLNFIVSSVNKMGCFKGVFIYGPMPCLVAKNSGKYRYMLIFKSEKRNILHQLIHWIEDDIIKSTVIKVRYSFDIDPQEMS